MKNKYVEILVGLSIAAICVAIGLYITGMAKLSILDNIIRNAIIKIVLTILVSIGFVLYISLLFKNRLRKRYVVGFSLLFEAIGSWWLNSWIGYIFIIIGTVLLILSFFPHYDWDN